MTSYPGSTWRPVPSHSGQMSAHLGLCLHVTTNHASPFGFFADPANAASSTWWVADDGSVEQYVDAELVAWAQAAGNSTYNSVETSGVPTEPLTPAQVEAVAQLYAWGARVYGWPLRLADSPGLAGLIYHSAGGAAWGGHYGCPGLPRITQRTAILSRAAELLATDLLGEIMALDPNSPDYKRLVGDISDAVIAKLCIDVNHPYTLPNVEKRLTAAVSQPTGTLAVTGTLNVGAP